MLKNIPRLEQQMNKNITHITESYDFRNDKKNESNVPMDDRFKELQISVKDRHPEAHQPNVAEEKVDKNRCHWGFNNKKRQWKGCVSWLFS